MTRREQRTVDLALSILRRSANDYSASRNDGVQLALRVLLPYVDRHSLTSFWTITENPNPSQRIHNLRSVFASIELSALRNLSGVGRPRR